MEAKKKSYDMSFFFFFFYKSYFLTNDFAFLASFGTIFSFLYTTCVHVILRLPTFLAFYLVVYLFFLLLFSLFKETRKERHVYILYTFLLVGDKKNFCSNSVIDTPLCTQVYNTGSKRGIIKGKVKSNAKVWIYQDFIYLTVIF